MKKVILFLLILAMVMTLGACITPSPDNDDSSTPDSSTPDASTPDSSVPYSSVPDSDGDSPSSSNPSDSDSDGDSSGDREGSDSSGEACKDYTIAVLEDAYVLNSDSSGDKSCRNYSGENEILVKTTTGASTRKGYLKFDISSLAKDTGFTCIELDLTVTNRQNDVGDPSNAIIKVYGCDPSADLTEVTYSAQPDVLGYVTANTQITTSKATRSFSITDYVKWALKRGDTEIVLSLVEATSATNPLLVRFAAKESGNNAPRLSVYYGTKTDGAVFCAGSTATSNPEISQNGLDAVLGQNKITKISATEDTYTDNKYPNANYGSSTEAWLKGNADKNTHRAAFFKFNLSGISADVGNARLMLYCEFMENEADPTDVFIYACNPDGWNESELTYNTLPEKGNLVTGGVVNAEGWVSFDVS